MKANKYWNVMTFVFIFCLLFLFHTKTFAGQKYTNQEKTVKVAPKVVRSRRMMSALKNRAVHKQLQQTVDLSSLTLQTTLSEAIELLRNSIEPPLKIVVMWRDLGDNANIDQDTTIQMDGVSGITLHTGLEILLRAVSSDYAKLGYIVKDGIIIVATIDSLPVKMSTRVYDISYLLAAPARYGFGFIPGFARGFPGTLYTGRRADRVSGIIRNTVRPNRWR